MNRAILPAEMLSAATTLEQLYPLLAARSIGAGWNKPEPAMWPQPKHNFLPFAWHYSDAAAAFEPASRLVSTGPAERRNLIRGQPVRGNMPTTLGTPGRAHPPTLPGDTARSPPPSPAARSGGRVPVAPAMNAPWAV